MEKDLSPNQRKYFPNLDGLRFVGSLIIIILHIEDIKFKHGREVIPWIRYFHPTGEMDVTLFFVLSGFLITFLLLQEKKKTNTIDLKAFYLRRTLRIWPLYFLIVILGFFVLPHLDAYFSTAYSFHIYKHFWLYFIGCILFLSPIVRTATGLPQTIGPIWSIGVEEVFYLCWPLFLKRAKNYLKLFILIIAGIILLRNAVLLCEPLFNGSLASENIFKFLRSMSVQYRISSMAIGGIGAYLVITENKKVLSFLFRRDVQFGIYLLTLGLLFSRIGLRAIGRESFPSMNYEWYSVLFMCIIVNLAANPKSIIKLDFPWMNYLGKISYGLYMYSPIMRILAMELIEKIAGRQIAGWQMNLIYYLTTILSTIGIAAVSYQLFEKRLLSFGKRFRVAKTA